jgi:signal transduction histidine kinase
MGSHGSETTGRTFPADEPEAEAAAPITELAALRSEVAQLREQNAALRRQVAELELDRRRAEESARQLRDLTQIKEEFIATASHDLKGPLTSILGYSQLLLRRLRSPQPDLTTIAQGLGVIAQQAVAMARLVDDLLDASRIQAGAFSLRRAPCELAACLDNVLDRLGPEDRRRVELRLADVPLAGEWDQRRIEQVLTNLITNALKYSPPDRPVTVAVERGNGEIEVAVSDEGMGIPSEELPYLFQRYYRTPQALASGLPGTGLGLYICRGIVEAHGGRIWAESPGVGQGATFRFTLPDRPGGAHGARERGAADVR